VAYLLEGQFSSFYDIRFPPAAFRDQPKADQSVDTKMLVFGDGDIIRNRIDKRTGQPVPLDVDEYTGMPISNKDFLLNAVAYLVEEDGLISTKSKEFTMRPLDKGKVQGQKQYWQFLNLALPVVFVVLFGVAWFYLRKRKYENPRQAAKPSKQIQGKKDNNVEVGQG
jgi:gliding-associated putative ABC transporter substrate-binding component GldG